MEAVMPKVDFDKYDEAGDFTPIPDGRYPAELDRIQDDRTTGAGDEMWGLRFVILQAPHQGRFVFDNLVFSEGAMGRVKLICSRLGVNVTGEVDLTPKLLLNRRCIIEVYTEEYEVTDEETGETKTKRRNAIPFAGFEKYEDDDGGGPSDHGSTSEDSGESEDDDLPF
jgi:hypothetical protein